MTDNTLRTAIARVELEHRRVKAINYGAEYACLCGEVLRSNSHHVLAEHRADAVLAVLADLPEFRDREAVVREYGEVYPYGGDDGETVTLHKHFGDDKTRPLEEGFALGARWVGPWTQIGEVQRYD